MNSPARKHFKATAKLAVHSTEARASASALCGLSTRADRRVRTSVERTDGVRAAGRDNCGRWISRKFRGIEKSARLRLIPGQPLEALKGDRKGQDSIRVNDQFRVCLEWRDRDAYNVEIVDYH